MPPISTRSHSLSAFVLVLVILGIAAIALVSDGGGFCDMFTVWRGRDAGGWRLAAKQPPLAPATQRLQQVITGARCCEPGLPPWPPAVFDLPEPLGDRELYDGAFFPPVPAQRYGLPTVIPL